MNMELVQREPLIINQDSLEQQFKDHLADTDNHRILFSGPFGQGKTSCIIKDCFTEGLIKEYDPDSKSRKFKKYIPFFGLIF